MLLISCITSGVILCLMLVGLKSYICDKPNDIIKRIRVKDGCKIFRPTFLRKDKNWKG